MLKLLALLYALAANLLFVAVYVYFIGFVGNVVVPKSIDSGLGGATMPALLVNVALLAAFALQHTVMARTGFKRALARYLPASIERASYVLMTTAVLAVLMWQWQAMPTVIWQVDNRIGSILLTSLFALGWGIGLVAAKAFDMLALFGLRQPLAALQGRLLRATPFATPSLYRLVRHPMMSGFLLSFWATPTMTVGHALFASVMTVYIVIAVKFFEERDLKNTFGENYARYQRTVPMLVPSLTPTRHRSPTADR